MKRILLLWLGIIIISTPFIDLFGNEIIGEFSTFQLIRGGMTGIGLVLIMFIKPKSFYISNYLVVWILYILFVDLILRQDINIVSIFHFLFLIQLSIVTYWLTFHNYISLNWLKKYLVYVVLVYAIIQVFFIIQNPAIEQNDYNSTVLLGGARNAVSIISEILTSIFVLFIFDFLDKKRKIIPIIILILIAGALRRTAIVTTLLIIIYSFYSQSKNVNILKLLIPSIILAITSFAIFSSELGLVLIERFQDKGGSGRLELWDYSVDILKKYDIYNLFFGKTGYMWQQTEQTYGVAMGAHNDILDFLLNRGILGLLLLLSFYFYFFFRKFRKMDNQEIKIIHFSSAIYFIITSLLSGAGTFTPKNMYFFVIYSFIIGYLDSRKLQKT